MEHVQAELTSLIKNNLIETIDMSSDTPDKVSLDQENSISITFKGYYYGFILVNRFHYFELVAQDTPIFDKELFNKINLAYPKPNSKGMSRIPLRLNFVKHFVSYLEKMERKGHPKSIEINQILDAGLTKDYMTLEKIDREISHRSQ